MRRIFKHRLRSSTSAYPARREYLQFSASIALFFILGLSLPILTGCSSLQRKAEKLMENKDYEDAQAIYQEILKSHPHDTDALLGLRKAREDAISSELLIVRRQRLGGNSQQANEDLRKILLSLRTWNVYPTGAVAFTQNEEMDYAVHDLEDQSHQALLQHHPLRVAYLVDHYRDFFQEHNLPILQGLHDVANKQGLDLCRAQLAGASKDLSYYREFLARECIFWGDMRTELQAPTLHGLFGRLDLKGGVPGIPEALRPRLENQIQHVLQESPWFDSAEQTVLHLDYDGSYLFKTTRTPTTFTHAYEEVEPYTSYELVTKHRSVPVEYSRKTVDTSGKVTTTTGTEYQDQSYSEMETITRTRTITKDFPYQGTTIEQNIELRTVLTTHLDGSTATSRLTANSSDRNVSAESQTEIPRFGLYARSAKVLNENEWFAQILDGWSRQNLEQLRDLWVQKHCQTFRADTQPAQQADRVFACERERSRTLPPFMNSWMIQNLGVSAVELQSILM